MRDKIIQIISRRGGLIGLSENGIIYEWILTDDEPRWKWVKVTDSPTISLRKEDK